MNLPAEDAPRGPQTDADDRDAHGRAALLLVESLIHGLAARGVLPAAETVAIVEVALDASRAIAEDASAPSPAMDRTTALLTAIADSLKIDLPGPAQ